MRGRLDRRGPARLVTFVIGLGAALVLTAVAAGAQPTTSEAPSTTASSTTATNGTTTTRPPVTAPPTTEAEAPPATAPPTTQRPATTARATTTRAPAATTTRVPATTSTTSTTTTTRPAATSTSIFSVTPTSVPPSTTGNETEGEIDQVVRLLFGIAAFAAVVGAAYAWHTSPRRRVRAAEARAERAARRLDDAVAASFVGTAVGTHDLTSPAVPGEADVAGSGAPGRSRRRPRPPAPESVADPTSADPRPDPRPRPNDAPWE